MVTLPCKAVEDMLLFSTLISAPELIGLLGRTKDLTTLVSISVPWPLAITLAFFPPDPVSLRSERQRKDIMSSAGR